MPDLVPVGQTPIVKVTTNSREHRAQAELAEDKVEQLVAFPVVAVRLKSPQRDPEKMCRSVPRSDVLAPAELPATAGPPGAAQI